MRTEAFLNLCSQAQEDNPYAKSGETYAIDCLWPQDRVYVPCTANPDRWRNLCKHVTRRTGKQFSIAIQRCLGDGSLEGVWITRTDAGTAEEREVM